MNYTPFPRLTKLTNTMAACPNQYVLYSNFARPKRNLSISYVYKMFFKNLVGIKKEIKKKGTQTETGEAREGGLEKQR